MTEPKGTRKKRTEQPAESETTADNTGASESEKAYTQATGLEDYGRWKSMFKDYKRDKNEKPFRRGRIWS